MKKLTLSLILFSIYSFSNLLHSQQNQRQTLAQSKIPEQYHSHPEFLKLELEDFPTNIELIQFRTADQRTFLDIEGNYHTQKTGGYYNYLKENQWLSIQEKLSFNQELNAIGIFESELPISVSKNSSTTKLILEKNTSKGFEFGQNASLSFLNEDLETLTTIEKNNELQSYEFNENTLIINDYFPNIKREQTINYWSVRTNYSIQSPLNIPSSSNYVELKDKLNLDPSFTISYGDGIETEFGWLGTLKITNQFGEIVGKISAAQIFDSFESNNKDEVATHIIPGYYEINQNENGIELILRFDANYLKRTDLVYPVIIDPTATNTYANNQGLQDKNTQYNTNCQASMNVIIPVNFYVVTGTNITYRIWAKGYIAQSGGTTNYADKVEQRSRVGSITWTATQNGAGTNHSGSGYTYTSANNGQTYTINNSNIANACYNTNVVSYRWQGYQTFFPFGSGATNVAGCVLNYQELVTNTWQLTTTYLDGPIINPVSSQTLCAGQQTTAVSFSGTGTSYTWTNNTTSIGLAASGTGTINAFTAINTTAAPVTATITVTPMLNGCAGTPTTFTITVNPSPTVTNPGNQTVCAGNSTNAINFSGTAGSTFNWTNNNTATGLAASGTTDIVPFVGTNTTTSAITSTISITPTLGTCNGTVVNFTITVSPTPTVTAPTNQTLCAGQQTSIITFSGNATTYNWTNDNTSIGLGASGTGNITPFTTTNTGTTAIVGTITVTPVSGTCTGLPITFTITVNNQITPTFTQIGPYCQNAAPATLPTNSTNSPSISGTWSPNTINTATVGNATYTFTPAANQCATSATMIVSTITQPTVTFSPQTICAGQTVTISPTVSPTGGTYLWSNNQTTSTITVTPSATTSYSVLYSVTGCNATATNSITVNPVLTPTFTQLGSYCLNDSPGVLPTSSTNGVTGTWLPSVISTSTAGNQTYNFTPTAGLCANTASMTITVNPLLTPTFGNFGPYCQNENVPVLPSNSTNTPSIAGTWSPSVINTSIVGTTNYTFTPTNSTCTGTTVIPIIVQLAPSPQVNSDVTQGCNPLAVNLSSPNLANASYTWTANGVVIGTGSNLSASFTSAGCYDIELVATFNGCTASSSIADYICVQNAPTTFFSTFPTEVSENTETINFYNNTNGAVTYSWDFGDGTSSTLFAPNHLFTNIGSNLNVTLTATSSFGCTSSYTTTIPYKDPTIFYVPNTFTPDGDEFNQTWGPVFTRGFDPHNFNLYIYDRWGELVWESHNASDQWDGTYGKSGKKAAQGVYIWRINFKPKETDDKITVSGHINLLK